ncbi:hypothetical protein AB1Y20_018149 [Prymnesium parvum]|uniref:Uncharacterized protein n=1 Tax=Prymnesium parvum TaxID=97485 RepID=A0AB34JNT3_PRYPA
MDSAIVKLTRPPTKRHLGKKLRASKPIPTVPELFQEQFLVAHGFPHEDEAMGLKRNADGTVQPKKKGATVHRYSIKLQDPNSIKKVMRLEERLPGRGLGAAKLVLSKTMEGKGLLGRKLIMCAAPVILKCTMPVGKAAKERFAMFSIKMNVVMMDENGTVMHVWSEGLPPRGSLEPYTDT